MIRTHSTDSTSSPQASSGQENNLVRTRFAPSPTGELHIGSVRTALFSYLFAKNQKGEFLLRIEDTDQERFVEGASDRIVESLKWLGIVPDNLDDIMVQSMRLETYKKHAFDLVKAGKAYICTCSKEDLEKERDQQTKAGLPPKYSGRCRDKSQIINYKSQTNSKLEIPKGAVIRMKMPQSGKIIVPDLVRGKVEFDASLLDDQIILKSDGYPTYHLASVIDDHEMEITHVIRAEEWLSSTPKHLVLYEMFGWKAPEFAHLSMILGPDKKKLSKRHGATSIDDYKSEGYLPEALVNFIALLGWNPKDERELFSLSELEKEFKLENANKAAAVFNVDKLNSINESYLRTEEPKNLMTELRNLMTIQMQDEQKCHSALDAESTLVDPRVKPEDDNPGCADAALNDGEIALIQRGGYKTLKEAAEYILRLRKEPEYEALLLVFKKSSREATLKGIKGVQGEIEALVSWDAESLQKTLEKVVIDHQLSNGDVFWPVRVALSGEEKSPSPVELMVALGKEETLKRIDKALERLNS